MVKTEYVFPSHDGRTPIHAIRWTPDSAPRAVIQIAHGVSEYIARYAPAAADLTEHGFVVVGNDHIGHGSSLAPGGAPLYFGAKGSWNTVVDDLYELRCRTGREFPGLPYFLLGFSMGSFLARTYLIRYPGTLSGAMLLGTGQMDLPSIAYCRAVAAREIHRIGETATSPVVNQLSFDKYNKIFSPTRTAYDWLSVSEENVDAYIADPQCGGSASVGLCRDMLIAMRDLQREKNLRRMNCHTPVLFASGAMDPVGDCGKGVRRAYRSFQRTGVRDVTLKLYPGIRHELLNDVGRADVIADLLAWLEQHMTPISCPPAER